MRREKRDAAIQAIEDIGALGGRMITELRAEVAQLRQSLAESQQALQEQPNVRKDLWLNHGCPIAMLYGDDGEMQCNNSQAHQILDFKRLPLATIVRALLEGLATVQQELDTLRTERDEARGEAQRQVRGKIETPTDELTRFYRGLMKTELRAAPHLTLPDVTVFEVWYAGEFLATVVGADGPGVRIISKHSIDAALSVPRDDGPLNVVVVSLGER